MTIPSSTAPAARRFLFDQLTAQLVPDPLSPTSSLLVCYDQPGPNDPDDIVAVGKVTRQINPNSLVGSGGPGWLEERYTVAVVIDVYRGGDDAPACFDRASLLVDQVCAVVRSDPSLGGAVLTARPLSSDIEGEWDAENLGRHAVATVDIECYQRI